MFIEESLWIREKLATLDIPPGSKVLNIGSSDLEFLKTQPHIKDNVLTPLLAGGCLMTNLDLKAARNGDYTGDITDKGLPGRLAERFKLVICTNLLEHVTDRTAAFDNLAVMAEDGGYILLTVPNNYPIHHDPIDTRYRPSAAELGNEIQRRRNTEILFSEVLEIKDQRYYRYGSRLPFWGYRKFVFWRRWFGKYRWKVSCIICRTKGPGSRPAATGSEETQEV